MINSLYVVTTPIGNLEDITFRAIRILKDVSLIAAEDTRVTRKLLTKYSINTKLISFNEHNKHIRIPKLLKEIKLGDIAIVSDAGTPGINDPAAELVMEFRKSGIGVFTIPGPSAVTAALSISGIVADAFIHLGFLPRKKSVRQKVLKEFSHSKYPVVIFESPHRILGLLEDINVILGDRKIIICRELTKKFEETLFLNAGEALSFITKPKGEYTLVVDASKDENKGLENNTSQNLEQVFNQLNEYADKGAKIKDFVNEIAETTGVSKNQIYSLWLEVLKSR
tara:strand:+ start:23205 stop:24050 length:846 start_codon:yes stop_codon:yes gene_type:complete